MSDRPPTSSTALPDRLGASLRSKLGAVRRKLVRVEFGRRLALAASVALLGLAVLLAVDWVTDLSLPVRTRILLTLGGLVAILLLRALAALWTQRRDEESLALMVEEREPGFRSRLIAAVQFARGKATVPDGDARRMVESMVDETEAYAKPMRLTEVVNTGPLRRALVFLFLLLGLGAGGYYAGGGITQDLLKRAFLSDVPVPRATRVVWTSQDLKVGIGDSVTVEAEVAGHEPAEGTLRIRYASGRRQKVRMGRRGNGNRYGATLENVQESFTFVVAINDGRSKREGVRALARPSLVEVVGKQSYPSYMNLPPSTHRPGEFLLYPESRLDLSITASHPLESGVVRLLGGQGNEVLAVVDEVDRRLLRARVRVDDALTGFTVELLDTEGMASRDATVYRVDVLSDEAPTVRIVKPSRQRELVTAEARVLVGYEAEDRFGIEKLVLSSRVLPDGEVRGIEVALPEQGAKKVSGLFDWELGQADPPLRVGDEIEFWIEASDRNDTTEAGLSASRILKVVTPREKRDDLLSRVGDSLGRIGQAADDQERLNTVLAEWIRAQRSLSDEALIPQETNE
ncbi:MAG: hypothetical protein CMP28_14615 [Roseibacillus sp.]|nr:hypothetical protein [Roseibacillus sp.]